MNKPELISHTEKEELKNGFYRYTFEISQKLVGRKLDAFGLAYRGADGPQNSGTPIPTIGVQGTDGVIAPPGVVSGGSQGGSETNGGLQSPPPSMYHGPQVDSTGTGGGVIAPPPSMYHGPQVDSTGTGGGMIAPPSSMYHGPQVDSTGTGGEVIAPPPGMLLPGAQNQQKRKRASSPISGETKITDDSVIDSSISQLSFIVSGSKKENIVTNASNNGN